MRRLRTFGSVPTRGCFWLTFAALLVAATGAAAQSSDAPPTADAPGGNAGAARQSQSPLEWNRSLMARGRVSERLGQNEDAMADYTLAIESHALPAEEQARALFDRGLLLDGMGRLDDAQADYTASLALSPHFAAALNNRGNIYRRLGRKEEARRDYQAALDAGNPQSQYSYYGLGEIAEAEGGKAEAREFYKRSLDADPKYDLARERLAALASGEQMARLDPPGPTPDQTKNPPAPPVAQEDTAAPIVLHPPPENPAPSRAHIEQANLTAPAEPVLKPSLENPRSTSRGHQGTEVQLGAWRSEAEANQGWDHALKRAGEALEGRSHRVMMVDLPRIGRYYRLRVESGQEGAKDLCARLVAQGLDCMPVRE